MKFALVDLKIPDKKANREHTGGFGSYMKAEGLIGTLISRIKSEFVELPIISFAFTKQLLENGGHSVSVFHGENVEKFDIVIVANSMHCYEEELNWIHNYKELNPLARVGVYGPFCQIRQELFEGNVDFIIGGELESSIIGFLDGLHDFNGYINYGVVTDLNVLPLLKWDGFDVKKFNYFPLLYKRLFFPIQSSRGCSFNCDFCPYMVSQTEKYRRRSPENVVNEIDYLNKFYDGKSFLFRDICFTLNKKHVLDICNLIILKGLKIEWACETRLDCLTDELIDKMVEAGLVGINIGIETGDNNILNNSGKKNPEIKQQEHIIRYLEKKKVAINAFYMLGLSGDTPKTMNNTIEYAKFLNTQGAQFCITTPFPGTKLFDQSRSKIIEEDYSLFTEYQPVMNIGSSTPKEVLAAHAKAYRNYYFNLAWVRNHSISLIKKLLINILHI